MCILNIKFINHDKSWRNYFWFLPFNTTHIFTSTVYLMWYFYSNSHFVIVHLMKIFFWILFLFISKSQLSAKINHAPNINSAAYVSAYFWIILHVFLIKIHFVCINFVCMHETRREEVISDFINLSTKVQFFK